MNKLSNFNDPEQPQGTEKYLESSLGHQDSESSRKFEVREEVWLPQGNLPHPSAGDDPAWSEAGSRFE